MNTIENIRSEIEKCLEALEAIKLFQLQILSANEIEARKLTYQQCLGFIDKYAEQEPISVSVSEKEPDEISEEVTLRFFRNTLKVRWQDMVIYNVEWLKKNWQMEMDIVCGVKPCDDVVSRQAIKKLKRHNLVEGQFVSLYDIEQLPSVRPQEQTGKWIALENRFELGDRVKCSECGQVFVVGDDVSRNYCPNCGCRMVEQKETETWHGIHAQITAPKGTFERIFNEADDDYDI